MILDKFTDVSFGKINYTGKTQRINEFVLNEQLYDETLWKIFVQQFRDRKDGNDNFWRGEFFGKMMRGACLTYQYFNDEKLYTVLENAVEDMLTTQDELGRFSTYEVDKELVGWDMWGRKYVMLAFEYFYEICKSEKLKARILTALEKHADYIVAHVGEGKSHPIAFSASIYHHSGLPSCSILEPMVKLYKLLGKQSYLDYAEEIVKVGFTNNEDNLVEIFYNKEKRPNELISKKAYEMMSCFQGLIEYYTVVKDEKYLTAVYNFVDALIEYEYTEIGAMGTKYEAFDDSAENQIYYKNEPMLETCVTVTFLNLCYRMLHLTGESRFADYIERSAYNAMFGAVNDEKNQTCYKWNEGAPRLLDTKYFMPFDSYSPMVRQRRAIDIGGCLQLRQDGMRYGCCTCISSTGTAISALYGLMQEGDTFVINAYEELAARLISPSGQNVSLQIVGKPFERDEVIKIKLTLTKTERLSFKLRIPAWSKSTILRCKGKEYQAVGGEYFQLIESFESGDEIELQTDNGVQVIHRGGKTLLRKCGYVLARDERYRDGFDEDVAIVEENGYAKTERSESDAVNAVAEFAVLTKDGKKIKVCDYSSAGKKWDEGKNMRLNVWF